MYICIVQTNKKQENMKRFSTTKTYLDKDGNRYSYEMKYRGYWQFYKLEKDRTLFLTFSETDLLKLDLKER